MFVFVCFLGGEERGLTSDAVWAKLTKVAYEYSRVGEFVIDFPVTKNVTAACICYIHFQT